MILSDRLCPFLNLLLVQYFGMRRDQIPKNLGHSEQKVKWVFNYTSFQIFEEFISDSGDQSTYSLYEETYGGMSPHTERWYVWGLTWPCLGRVYCPGR